MLPDGKIISSGRLSDIVPEEISSWYERIFLTVDIDWAHDEVLADAISLIEEAGIYCTWFVTHDTRWLSRLRSNPKFELGIHPNFNWLLAGDARNGINAREVILRLMNIVPEARSVRSHSVTQSSVILELFSEAGLTHDSNCSIPITSKILVKPWRLWNNMVRVPYQWEDSIALQYMERKIKFPDAKQAVECYEFINEFIVFNFHPIHIFLNTESLHQYEAARAAYHNPEELALYRNPRKGVRTWLIELLDVLS